MSRRISLVLGSGGARGLAHIGAIQALEAHDYEIASISGSSMGALVGGLILGVAESTSTLFLPATLKQVVSFSLLIIIMLFRPQGLFGGKR